MSLGTREELRAAMEVSAEDFHGAGGEALAAELQHLRSLRRQLEEEGRQMQEELWRRQAEADQLVEELSAERRLRQELDLRLVAPALTPSHHTSSPANEARGAEGRWSPS